MRHRKVTTIDVDGIEVTLDNNPEYFEPLTLQPTPDTLVVGYLLHDEDCGNPMTDHDCEGKLYTKPERSGGGYITDDGSAAGYLGLEEFSDRYGHYPDLAHDGVDDRIAEKLQLLIKSDQALTSWMVANAMETGMVFERLVDDLVDEMQGYHSTSADWSSDEDQEMIARLPSYATLAEVSWNELYAEGKIGEYLAVPVNFCGGNHGPGTSSAHTTSLDNANAVWVPCKCAIENMNFPAGATHVDKLKVAEKYAGGVLESYISWANGDAHGVVVETFRLAGGTYERIESDSCWGFIGYEYAEKELAERMEYEANKLKEAEGVNA